jgi:hypothetical protein
MTFTKNWMNLFKSYSSIENEIQDWGCEIENHMEDHFNKDNNSITLILQLYYTQL